MDDRQRDISIADAFGRFEDEDEDEVENLHREDTAARTEARPALPARRAPRAVGTHVSNFWRTMESEDSEMGKELDKDRDLAKYEQMVHLQDHEVEDAASQLERPRARLRSLQREVPPGQAELSQEFMDTPIHDAFGSMEAQ